MKGLAPLETLYNRSRGDSLPLPSRLRRLYGDLRVPEGRPAFVFGNFASTLDGVVALDPDRPSGGGGEITHFDRHDRLVMGLLRSIADAVVVGAGTLRSVPKHRWTSAYIFPELDASFVELRRRVTDSVTPLNVIVTARGRVDLRLPVFRSGDVDTLLVTTATGARRLASSRVPPSTRVASVGRGGKVSAASVLRAVQRHRPARRVLVEGGPHLMADFLSERRLHELFLTLAPQVAGRNDEPRPGLVAGRTFAPTEPRWSELADVRRAGDLLFLRYAFSRRTPSGASPHRGRR
jgi:riboflavin biosynthesis pyrimidine reductase